MYELISVENGDVLFGHDDRDFVIKTLLDYVDTHRASRPGLEAQVAFIELDEDGRKVGETLFYPDLAQATDSARG